MNQSRKGVLIAWRGFTLIELLIVVAIIAILALIAVPNFLEAQARAKVSRAKTDLRTMVVAYQAYMVDWNTCLRDANDWDTPPDLRPPFNWYVENPGQSPDMEFTVNSNFYTFRQWRPLTTPVSYVTLRPTQGAFSRNVPYGQDTREINNSIVYWVILCGGVDMDNGDWFRDNNRQHLVNGRPTAVPYDPTNGTVSNGDIWRGEKLVQTNDFDLEYGPWPMSP